MKAIYKPKIYLSIDRTDTKKATNYVTSYRYTEYNQSRAQSKTFKLTHPKQKNPICTNQMLPPQLCKGSEIFYRSCTTQISHKNPAPTFGSEECLLGNLQVATCSSN